MRITKAMIAFLVWTIVLLLLSSCAKTSETKQQEPAQSENVDAIENNQVATQSETASTVIMHLKTRATWYNSAGTPTEWSEFKYDEYGRVQKITSFTTSGAVVSYSLRDYSTNELCETITTYNASGLLQEKTIEIFDELGREVSRVDYDGSGRETRKHEIIYNDSGNILTETYYLDGELSYWNVYNYDGNSVTTVDTKYIDSEYDSNTKYYYDDAGRLVKKTKSDKWDTNILDYECSYNDEEKSEIETYYHPISHGKIISRSKSFYDENGNEIKMVDFTQSNNINLPDSVIEKEYDDTGNLIKYIYSSNEEEEYCINEYEDIEVLQR